VRQTAAHAARFIGVRSDPRSSLGLDGALHAILAQPFGRFLLTAVALGFAAFGLFALLESRHRRM
jgi:Domain of Unknown Function (DUF1206)